MSIQAVEWPGVHFKEHQDVLLVPTFKLKKM